MNKRKREDVGKCKNRKINETVISNVSIKQRKGTGIGRDQIYAIIKTEKVTYNKKENLKIVENLQDFFYTVPMKRHGQR